MKYNDSFSCVYGNESLSLHQNMVEVLNISNYPIVMSTPSCRYR